MRLLFQMLSELRKKLFRKSEKNDTEKPTIKINYSEKQKKNVSEKQTEK